MSAVHQTLQTPDGPFTLVADDDGAVLASGWTQDVDLVLARIAAPLRPFSTEAADTAAGAAVTAYYSGEHDAILSVAVRQTGGPFRTAAWEALRRIPAGAPLTYSAFAHAVGSPTAVRAAASACATNAPALFVPCHRVLRTDGSLGGFAWGMALKRSLLDRESARAESVHGTAGLSLQGDTPPGAAALLS